MSVSCKHYLYALETNSLSGLGYAKNAVLFLAILLFKDFISVCMNVCSHVCMCDTCVPQAFGD